MLIKAKMLKLKCLTFSSSFLFSGSCFCPKLLLPLPFTQSLTVTLADGDCERAKRTAAEQFDLGQRSRTLREVLNLAFTGITY